MSLFQGIDQFRGQVEALNIQVVFRKDGQLHVSVTPKVDEKSGDTNQHLSKPFALHGTAAELDAGFVSALTPVATTRASLAEQAKAEAEALKAAAAAKKPAAKSTTAKAAPTRVASGTVSFDDDTDNDGEDEKGSTSTASAPAPAAAAPAPQSTDTLFD